MMEDLQQEAQPSADEILETQAETVEVPEGETAAPETETEEQTNARIQAEDAERARRREEKRQNSIQKRMDELTRQRYEEKARADYLERQIEDLRRNQVQTPKDDRPTREQFDTYEDYLRADAKWEARAEAERLVEERIGRLQQSQTQQTQEARQQESRQAAERQFQERVSTLKKEIPDFMDAIEDWEPNLPGGVVDTIVKLPEGPLLTYHLAKNPDLEARFHSLPPEMHGVYIGQLISTLKSSQKPSAAPAPGKPVGSTKSGSSIEPPDDPAKYRAWANKHLR